MLSERSRETLDDLLVTLCWKDTLVPEPNVQRQPELLEALASEKHADADEDIATWLCEERNLPAAMAEEIVTAYRAVRRRPVTSG